MNVSTIFAGAASGLVVILFGDRIDLTSGAGSGRKSFLRGAFMIRCPRCQSEGIRRSKRRGFVERGPLSLVFLRPFRCKRCERRLFRWPINFNDQSNDCMRRGSQSARTSHKFVSNLLSNPPMPQTRSLGLEGFRQMNGNSRNVDARCSHPLMFDTLRAAEPK